MTFDEYATPQSEVSDRRPWDEVLEEFAAKTGRPLWTVTHCRSSIAAKRMRGAA